MREAAAYVLGQAAGSHPEALERLLAFARHQDWNVRRAAATAFGPAASRTEALDLLMALADDEDATVQEAVAYALGQAAPRPEIIDRLLALLDEEIDMAAYSLKKILAKLRQRDREWAIPRLEPLARSRNIKKRDIAYVGLRALLAADDAPEISPSATA